MVRTDRQTDISPRNSTRLGLLSLTPITLYIQSFASRLSRDYWLLE